MVSKDKHCLDFEFQEQIGAYFILVVGASILSKTEPLISQVSSDRN